jgi:hypothetical protein
LVLKKKGKKRRKYKILESRALPFVLWPLSLLSLLTLLWTENSLLLSAVERKWEKNYSIQKKNVSQ